MRYWTLSRSSSSSSFSFSPSKPATTNLTKIESSSSSMISSQTTTTTTSINSIPGTFNSPVFSVDSQTTKPLCVTHDSQWQFILVLSHRKWLLWPGVRAYKPLFREDAPEEKRLKGGIFLDDSPDFERLDQDQKQKKTYVLIFPEDGDGYVYEIPRVRFRKLQDTSPPTSSLQSSSSNSSTNSNVNSDNYNISSDASLASHVANVLMCDGPHGPYQNSPTSISILNAHPTSPIHRSSSPQQKANFIIIIIICNFKTSFCEYNKWSSTCSCHCCIRTYHCWSWTSFSNYIFKWYKWKKQISQLQQTNQQQQQQQRPIYEAVFSANDEANDSEDEEYDQEEEEGESEEDNDGKDEASLESAIQKAMVIKFLIYSL